MNMSLRLLVVELIITFHQYFEEDRIVSEFLPLFIKELNKCTEYYNNWILDSFGTVAKFVISLRAKFSEAHVESLDRFLHVWIAFFQIRVIYLYKLPPY